MFDREILVMFNDRVEQRPEFAGYEGLGSSKYSGRENIFSPFNISGNAGYWFAGDLDRPPVHPARESLRRRLPRFTQYCADEAWKLVTSQRRDQASSVDEFDDLILRLQAESGLESMFSDSERSGFPDQLVFLRARTPSSFSGSMYLQIHINGGSRMSDCANRDYVYSRLSVTCKILFSYPARCFNQNLVSQVLGLQQGH